MVEVRTQWAKRSNRRSSWLLYYCFGTFLGKQVSFTRSFEIDSFAYSIDYSGTVTAVVINLSGEPEFC